MRPDETPDPAPPSTPVRRWDDPDGSWWELGWDQTAASYHATKFTFNDAGEQIVVDHLDPRDNPSTTVEALAASMLRSLPPDLTRDLAADAARAVPVTELGVPVDTDTASPVPLGHGARPMGTNYRIGVDDGTWWEVGWDKPLGTFYAHRLTLDPDEGDRLVEEPRMQLGQVVTIEQLGEMIRQPVPLAVAHELAADAAAHPFEAAPRFLEHAERVALNAPGGEASERVQLLQWETSLRAWEDRLVGWSRSLYAQDGVEALWSLPAEPVAEVVRTLYAESGDGDIATFATGIGLDRQLVDDLLADGVKDNLDVDRIAQVCEGLHCSPYDVWGAEQAVASSTSTGPSAGRATSSRSSREGSRPPRWTCFSNATSTHTRPNRSVWPPRRRARRNWVRRPP